MQAPAVTEPDRHSTAAVQTPLRVEMDLDRTIRDEGDLVVRVHPAACQGISLVGVELRSRGLVEIRASLLAVVVGREPGNLLPAEEKGRLEQVLAIDPQREIAAELILDGAPEAICELPFERHRQLARDLPANPVAESA